MYPYLLYILIIVLLPELSYCQLKVSNDVSHIDVHLFNNSLSHNTYQYRQTRYYSPYSGSSIVLRRGQPFNITIHLKQTYDKGQDRIRLEFAIGPEPQLDKGTLFYTPVEEKNDQTQSNYDWSGKILSVNDNQLRVSVNLPVDMAIGVWRLRVSTKLVGTRNIQTYLLPTFIYVIFNPWCSNDEVFLIREDARQEYVLTEMGKIYVGSYTRPTGKKWNFGQFHESVLPSMMHLLDNTFLTMKDRADIVKVSRAVSAVVNSHDENGLLVGNWSGNYGDGLAPWQWTGSAAIFDRFLSLGRRPVKFAQCWVFGGVTTTALRTLGIPARSITNFVSAHDTDLSLTVDKFYGDDGVEIQGINGDSVWNFHVWSEAWMARYDLPPGFGGWQAIDATPQETSMGIYQLGPASLEAIKQGKVGFAYDVAFVYSEVNADVIHWRLDPATSMWRRYQLMTDHIGRRMFTKMIGVLDERSRFGVLDAEDIVDQYKYLEGSPRERQVYNGAVNFAGLSHLYS